MKHCSRCGTDKPLNEFYARRPDCKVCTLERRAAYREQNRARINLEKQEHHKRNPHLKWRYRYEERVREAGMSALAGEFTKDDVVAIYGDACAHCGGPFQELDHFPMPVSRGGTRTLDNVRPACTACNRKTWLAA